MSITVAIVLHRNEKGRVGVHNSKNLTLSWGAGLAEAFYKLEPDRGVGMSLTSGSQTRIYIKIT